MEEHHYMGFMSFTFEKIPCINFSCKLVPGQYWEHNNMMLMSIENKKKKREICRSMEINCKFVSP